MSRKNLQLTPSSQFLENQEDRLQMSKLQQSGSQLNELLKKKKYKKLNQDGDINEIEETVIFPDDAQIILQERNLPPQHKNAISELQLHGEYFGYNFQADQDEQEFVDDGMEDAVQHQKKLKDDQKKKLMSIVRQIDPNLIRDSIQKSRFNDLVDNQDETNNISVYQLMNKLENDKSWTYIKVLISFLKKKGQFWYTKRPGLYDKLSKALIHMNNDSVDGLIQVYKLTTFWPQQVYSGFPKYSNLKNDNQEMIRGQNFGQTLENKYIQTPQQKRDNIPRAGLVETPNGQYNNQAKIAAWAIPMNVTYGSKDSITFLKSLQNCKNNEIFKIPVVQGYLNYKWDQARIFLTVEAILHAFYLLSFNVYALTTAARDSLAAQVLVYIFSGIFFIREILQIIGRKSTYFTDPWNYPDLGMILCCVTATIIDPIDQIRDQLKEWIFVLAILLLWTRVLSYFRLWGRTRHLIRAITQTVADMIPFLLIVFAVMFGYSTAIIAAYEEDQIESLKYNLSIFDAFELLSGNIIVDKDNDITYFVFTVISLTGLIVLLNMLIALMGDTFGRVQSNRVIYDYRERLSVNIDLESLMYICMRKAKPHVLHIGVIRRPGGFEAEGTEWQGAETQIKKIAKIGFRDVNKEIVKLQSEISKM